MSFPVEIRNADAIRLIGTPHIGAYYKISEAFSRLGAIIGSRGLWPQTGNMVGIFYDSPHDTPEDQLNSFAAVQTGIDAPEGLELREIPAGERAILTLKGPYSGLQAAYDYLYGPWLAASDRSPSDAPSFEIYLNSPLDTAQGDLLTEIHLPLS